MNGNSIVLGPLKQRELTVSVSGVAVRVAMPLLQLPDEVLALT